MIFKKMLEQCGLDRQEAANYLGYSLGAIKKWITGERELTIDVITKLCVLNDQINKNADRIAAEILKNGALINNDTIHLLENELPLKEIRAVCMARAVFHVGSKRLAAEDKAKAGSEKN